MVGLPDARGSRRSLVLVTSFVLLALLFGFIPPPVQAQTGLPVQAFEATTLPAGWSVTPPDGPGWSFNNPGSRTNQTGGQQNFAIADSDHAGHGVAMDTSLITPQFSLAGVSTARLQFQTFFRPHGNSTADVDVSTDGGTTWTNVWRTTTQVSGLITVNLSAQAANQSNVRLRFRYYNATWDWYWQLDDVRVEGVSAAAAPTGLSATVNGSQVALSWNAVTGASQYRVERSSDGTTWNAVTTVASSITRFTDSQGLMCGRTYSYRILALNAAGPSAPSNVATAEFPACADIQGLNEAFTATTTPAGWSVQNNVPGDGWRFDDPANRKSILRDTDNFAIVERLSGSNQAIDTELRTPPLNLAGRPAVSLSFRTFFFINEGNVVADVDVSSDGGTSWTNVWRATQTKNSNPLRTITVDLTATAGNRNNVIVRFRLSSETSSSLWIVDDVRIESQAPPATPTNLSAALDAGGAIKLTWTGGGIRNFDLERALGNGEFASIATITNGATSFIDVTVASETAYRYRVRARNAAGASEFGNIATITSGNRVVRFIDLSVSYYDTAANANTKRAAIEANLRYFADAVYEMSNGANKLRRIEIYTNGNRKDQADIVWIASCWPNAHISGFGRPGWRIEHCDNFQNTSFIANDAAHRQGGYTLGHEMGHYFYSLFDEYRGDRATGGPSFPLSGDTPVENSVMNSQWRAVDGDMNWLNFSTALNNTRNNAQHRVYGASAWETLARPLNEDPRSGQRSTGPVRLFHPELAAVAPAAGQPPRIDLVNEAARQEARSALDPVWVGSNAGNLAQAEPDFVRQLVIDTSAAMTVSELNALKTVLKSLIDNASLGTMIGISTYSITPTVVQAPIVIANDTTRTQLKTALDGITLENNAAAAMGDALATALSGLNSSSVPASARRVVYLFSATMHNEGSHPFTQVGAYQQASVPIYTFDLGLDDRLSTELLDLADATDGDYFAGTSVVDLRLALSEAEQLASPQVITGLTTGEGSTTSTDPFTKTFHVDASLGAIQVDIFFVGDADAATLTLLRPNGTASGATFTTFSEDYGLDGQFTLASTRIVNPAPGNWELRVGATEADVDLIFWVDAEAKAGESTFFADVQSVTGNQITAPEPILIEAFIAQNFPIARAGVRAIVEAPNGTVSEITMRDDGIAPDFMNEDGFYSALVNYQGDGEYFITVFFDNNAGTAVFSEESVAPTQAPDGATRPSQMTPVEGNFQRFATTSVFVSGGQEQDQADDFESATVVQPNNTPVVGRIDFAGDIDTFRVDVPSNFSGELVLRMDNLALGMDPFVFAFADDDSWELSKIFDTEPTSNDVLVLALPPSAGKTIYIMVMHLDPDATEGWYDLSVGPPIVGERISDPINAKPDVSQETVFLPLVVR